MEGYCLGIFEKVDVMVLHDRVVITDKDGTRYVFRLTFDIEKTKPKRQRKS